MFSKIKNRIKDDKGVVAIFVGIALVALVGMLAYVIDTGSLYETRRSMQSAADAAALAGAQELPENPDVAVQVALDYVDMQGLPVTSTDVSIERTFVSNDTIKVTVSDPNKKTFFAGIFGINRVNVGATATAMVGSPSEITGVLPWAVLQGTYTPGVEYNLKYGSPDLGPGNFGAVAIDGRGASTYRQSIEYGSTTPLHIGSIIETEPGNMTGPTSQGTSARIYDHPNNRFDTFSQLTEQVGGVYKLVDPDSQYIIVPIVDHFPNGRKDVTIVGFLQFIITYLNGSTVKGTLINYALVNDNSDVGGVNSTGFRSIRLLK
jgi:Flp pilus assembly protein TadG